MAKNEYSNKLAYVQVYARVLTPSQCFLKLNSWILLVRSSSELVVHCAREIAPKDSSSTPPKDRLEGPHISPQPPIAIVTLVQIPLVPTLIANTFPEVTDIYFPTSLI